VKGEGIFCNLHLEEWKTGVDVQFEENAHVAVSAKGGRCLVEGEGTFCNLASRRRELGVEEGEVTILLNFENHGVLLDNIQFEENASGAASTKTKV